MSTTITTTRESFRVDLRASDVSIVKRVVAEDCKLPSSALSSLPAFLRALWLFTESDVPTFVVPDTCFGVLGAMSGVLTTDDNPGLSAILLRTPLVVLYVWTNLLIFDLANQRLPEAVVEDRLNKPWRPIPTGQMTTVEVRRLTLAALPITFIISWILGVWKETAILFTLTWMYNDLHGGDEDFIIRNVIICIAFAFYNEGALRVACGQGHIPTLEGYVWTAIISGVILMTMQIQDLKDQAGDKAKGRRTTPLVLGDTVARITIAMPVLFWSLVCPLFWRSSFLVFSICISLGSLIVARVLCLREPADDRKSWMIWAGWLCWLYLLPAENTLLRVLATHSFESSI